MSGSDGTFRDAFRELVGTDGAPPIDALQQVWPTIAGDTFAAHTRPVGWSDARTLRMTADSAAWLSELSRRRHQLLKRLNQKLPLEIEAIEVADRPRPSAFPARRSLGDDDDDTTREEIARAKQELRDNLDDAESSLLDKLPEELRDSMLGVHPSVLSIGESSGSNEDDSE